MEPIGPVKIFSADPGAAPAAAEHEDPPAQDPGKVERERQPLAKASASVKVTARPSIGARVSLSVDMQLREAIIRVVDSDTGEVIRQIPSEELLKQRRAYQESQRQTPSEGNTGVA